MNGQRIGFVGLGSMGGRMTRRLVQAGHSAGPLAAFGLADSLGYRDQISNRVVDALGDLAGGVRLHDDERDAGKAGA